MRHLPGRGKLVYQDGFKPLDFVASRKEREGERRAALCAFLRSKICAAYFRFSRSLASVKQWLYPMASKKCTW